MQLSLLLPSNLLSCFIQYCIKTLHSPERESNLIVNHRLTGESTRTSATTTKYSYLEDIKTHENAKLPFFRLPLELKTRIYEYVCGGKTIHIHWCCYRLSHHLCDIDSSEEEAQKNFDASNEVWYAIETVDRHRCCFTDTTHRFNPSRKVDTRLLLCCQQMYLESNLIPYYANTFSFGSADSLSNFCRLIPRRQSLVIRNLHVRMIARGYRFFIAQKWHKAFDSVTTSLKGLQQFHITMEHFPDGRYPVPGLQRPAVESLSSDILQVGKLDLKLATVILSDSHFTQQWLRFDIRERKTDERWTLAQKQEWSRYIRKALLHYEDRDTELAKVR